MHFLIQLNQWQFVADFFYSTQSVSCYKLYHQIPHTLSCNPLLIFVDLLVTVKCSIFAGNKFRYLLVHKSVKIYWLFNLILNCAWHSKWGSYSYLETMSNLDAISVKYKKYLHSYGNALNEAIRFKQAPTSGTSVNGWFCFWNFCLYSFVVIHQRFNFRHLNEWSEH